MARCGADNGQNTAHHATAIKQSAGPETGDVTISKISPAIVLLDCSSNGTTQCQRWRGVLKKIRWETNDSILALL